MESLSPKQVSEIKDLYASVYKSKEEVEEAPGTPSSLEEEVDAFTDELVENVVKSLQDKLARSDRAGVFGQLERLRRKAFGTKDESDKARKYEINKNIIDKQKGGYNKVDNSNSTNITPVNSKPKDTVPVAIGSISPEGKKDAAVNKMEFKKNKEIEALKKKNTEITSNNKVDTSDNKVDTSSSGGLNLKDMSKYSPTKEFDSNTFKTDPVKVKPTISPATFKTNQNQSRDLVKTGKLKDTDLNKYSRSSSYTADDGKTQVNRSTVNTIAKFDMGPNIKKGDKLGVISGNMRKKYDMKASSFKPEAYDLVLDYVLSEGHADSVEEAHYVMTQMDEETIQTIVEFIGGRPGDGYIGHPNLDIKNPLFRGKRTKGTVLDKSNADKLPDVNVNKVGAQMGDYNIKMQKMIDDI